MKKELRFSHILAQLEKEKSVTFASLSLELNVSEDTIRRDIDELANLGLLAKIRGGAMPRSAHPLTFKDRIGYLSEDKERMALKAIRLLRNGMTVFMDSGTSVYTLVSLLPVAIELRVITNNAALIPLLGQYANIETQILGGKYNKEREILTGLLAVKAVEQFRADLFFMGVCSIDLQAGITATHQPEAELKRAMAAASLQVIALSDASKLGTQDPFAVCRLAEVSHIITERNADDARFEPYQKAGVRFL
ncbi:DeoR family transcriptional regulator [Siphonobacter sp. BAB-5385]|uniref:DeoR/GlpR family DNA-binding transcription regulator n=1 Tax=Siphonobacter sp. BAB-5385 TaxID=1864822 RepID=UPI000B9E492C|nr:DeoR/GlpR family DNA-binding transcription regulator [Siphonobacter sp. BAB-5385]OZI07381.1 DeoR family transcriptional regulator [Siphonobacter sp. BAB-5385]